ncbi:hypothetical protein GCM10027445_61010 [Amycolatopsis endophytica]|uniref:DUF308 domain-containing protein n=1 Tax=Amycolatopsis endophytica TaxID=860233 RepID=A0A853B612_9PSEU|nr:hypothetical protein [Amycolatopsis endophytica]NYI90509.1 hypothetical protein [Amycolatopsis endophytica]
MSARVPDPEDVDATFAAIVADLRAEGVGLIGDDVETERTPARPESEKPAEPEKPSAEASWRGGGTAWEDTVLGDDPSPEPAGDEEHYVPPEPPPLPRPGKGAFVVLLFFVAGLLLLIVPGVVGISTTVATPLGILALATAIALLLLRVKQGPPDGDGAQV